MKIQYASDLHLEFADNWRYLRDNPLQVSGDILILAGDIGYLEDQNYQNHPFWDWASENYRQVLVVPGNHEFYKYYDLSKMEDGTEGEIRKNIHYYYNKVVRIDDVDFILSTLWALISKEYAPYVEYGVTDFHRIMYGNRVLTYTDFNMEHDNCFYFIKKSEEVNSMGPLQLNMKIILRIVELTTGSTAIRIETLIRSSETLHVSATSLDMYLPTSIRLLFQINISSSNFIPYNLPFIPYV